MRELRTSGSVGGGGGKLPRLPGLRQAKPGRLERGWRHPLKLLIGTQRVSNPARPSVPAAGTECCVVVGATLPAKRTQGVCRPCD